MRRRRILFWAPTAGSRPSGILSRLEGLIPALVASGSYELALVHAEGLPLDRFPPQEELRRFVAPRRLSSPLGRVLHQAGYLETVLSSFEADAVVAETLPLPAHPGLVATVHDLRQQERSWPVRRLHARWLRRGLARAAQAHVPSQAIAAELEALLPGTHPRVVPNGVDLGHFRPGPVASDAAILGRRGIVPPYLLFVGHFEPRKGWGMSVSVARELARRHRRVPVVLVGQGEELPEEALAAAHGAVGRRIGRVFRDVGHEELPALLRGAVALLAPARLEGFGIVPLEAMACGTPVIASSIPAHREVLGGAGCLVPPGDVEATFQSVVHLLDHPEDRIRLSEQGRARARSFGWATSALLFENAIDAL